MADKRYPASQKKLKKAREDGDIAKSKDLTSAIALIAGTFILVFGSSIVKKIIGLFGKSFVIDKDFSTEIMLLSLLEALISIRNIVFPLLLVVFVAVLLVEGWQVGFHINFKPLAPDLSRLSFSKNFKRLYGGGEDEPFGIKPFISGIRYTLLILIFGLVCAVTVFFSVVEWVNADSILVHELFAAMCWCLVFVLFAGGLVCLVLGICDYFIQKMRRQKRLAMTADELKREFRESEGSPELKDTRRRLHQEVVVHQLVQGVRKARVLIVGKK